MILWIFEINLRNKSLCLYIHNIINKGSHQLVFYSSNIKFLFINHYENLPQSAITRNTYIIWTSLIIAAIIIMLLFAVINYYRIIIIIFNNKIKQLLPSNLLWFIKLIFDLFVQNWHIIIIFKLFNSVLNLFKLINPFLLFMESIVLKVVILNDWGLF